jgi:tetratricopeptide (TPR) repeat protein
LLDNRKVQFWTVISVLLVAGVFVVLSKIPSNENVKNNNDAINSAYQALSSKDYDKAISELSNIQNYSTDNKTQAYSALGQAYFAKKEYDKSVESYKSAENLESSVAKKSYYENLVANSLRDKGDIDGAITEYRLAVNSDAKNATAWVNMISALRIKGDMAAAKSELDIALVSNPNNESIEAIQKKL